MFLSLDATKRQFCKVKTKSYFKMRLSGFIVLNDHVSYSKLPIAYAFAFKVLVMKSPFKS